MTLSNIIAQRLYAALNALDGKETPVLDNNGDPIKDKDGNVKFYIKPYDIDMLTMIDLVNIKNTLEKKVSAYEYARNRLITAAAKGHTNDDGSPKIADEDAIVLMDQLHKLAEDEQEYSIKLIPIGKLKIKENGFTLTHIQALTPILIMD